MNRRKVPSQSLLQICICTNSIEMASQHNTLQQTGDKAKMAVLENQGEWEQRPDSDPTSKSPSLKPERMYLCVCVCVCVCVYMYV